MYFVQGLIKKLTTIHLTSKEPNVFIFSTPRSGSTWVMEVITKFSKAKRINEPFDMRDELVVRYSGFSDWKDVIDQKKIDQSVDYLGKLISGKYSFKNRPPFTQDYRMVVDHSVAKILHGCENYTDELCKRLNAKCVFLIRHPIPFSLSTKQIPRLASLIETNYPGFDKDQLKFINNLHQKGSYFQHALLEWAYQNYFANEKLNSDCVFITYEQMVVNPSPIIHELFNKGMINSVEEVFDSLAKPSMSSSQSSEERLKLLANADKEPEKIISNWKKKVTKEQIDQAQEILDFFGITIYRAADIYPANMIRA